MIVVLAGCGSDSPTTDAASTSVTSTTVVAESTTTTTDSGSNSGSAPAPTQAPSGSSTGSDSALNFKNICEIVSVAEMEAATGISGLTARSSGVTSDQPQVTCTWDVSNPPVGTGGIAFLGFDPSQSVSYGRQPDDHGLNGFELKAPTPDEIAFGQAHPGTGRGIAVVSWVYQSHPIRVRINEATAAGTKTIAMAQQINAKLPT